MSESEDVNASRRNLIVASATAGGVAAVGVAVPFATSMFPSERAKAMGAPIEVDISTLVPGSTSGILTGVVQTAERSVSTLKKIIDLKAGIETDRIMHMGKRSPQAMDLLHGLFKNPVVSVKAAQDMTGLSPKAANDLVAAFVEKGILLETTGFQRNRSFVFHEYLDLFNE